MKTDKHIKIRRLIREELLKLEESRTVTFAGEILSNIAKNVPDLKAIASNYMGSGSEGIYRYKDGNAYEIQVRPIAYANDKEHWRRYTSKKSKTKKGDKITTEDMKQALWLAFKETADKIDYIGEENGSHKFQINYNETFDLKNMAKNIHKLALYGIGTFILEEAGKGYIILKHLKNTGSKSVFDELMQQQQG
jgi:hypothetical protein